LACAVAGFIFVFLVIASALFVFAGTLHDGRAWVMLAVFFGCAGAISVWLWFRDKALLERRVKAGPGAELDAMQNIVQALAGLVFLATFAVPGLDERLGWSQAPLAVSIVGDAMIAIGLLIVLPHLSREHPHRRHDRGRRGPDRHRERSLCLRAPPHVRRRARHDRRHPPALGSWWGLLPAALLVPVLVWRLLREETFLAANLPGYDAYRGRVRCRLVPIFW
jgi:protein-S-isoprenylcysteine O-methyltransferase Ste14